MPVTTCSVDETLELGRQIGELLSDGDTVALYGEIGAGKTHLVKGIASAQAIPVTAVSSPSFAIVNLYEGRAIISHIDTYRTSRLNDLLEIGVEELLYDHSICIVEWPEILEPVLPDNCIKLELSHSGETCRTISLLHAAADQPKGQS